MHMILTHKQKQRLICVRVVLLKQRVTLKSSGNSIKTEMSHSNQNQDFAIVRCIKMTLGCLKIPKKAKRWFLGIAKFRRWSPNRFTISRYHYRYTPNRYPLVFTCWKCFSFWSQNVASRGVERRFDFFTNHFSLFSFSDWNLGRFSRSKCCVEGGGGWNDFSKLNQTYFPFSYSDWNLGDFRSQQMLRRGGGTTIWIFEPKHFKTIF